LILIPQAAVEQNMDDHQARERRRSLELQDEEQARRNDDVRILVLLVCLFDNGRAFFNIERDFEILWESLNFVSDYKLLMSTILTKDYNLL
jgi:hypothetical protein